MNVLSGLKKCLPVDKLHEKNMKKLKKNSMLKVTEESRIRSWIQTGILFSEVRIRGSGSDPHQNDTDPKHC
jgi:hypothetical protein